MEPRGALRADSPRSTSFPCQHQDSGDSGAIDGTETRLGPPDCTYAQSNGSRRHSDRSTSSSRFTGPEPPSERHAESSVGPEILPPSPSAMPMDRHHNRSYSSHSAGSRSEFNNVLAKRINKSGHIFVTPPPSEPILRVSDSSRVQPPPPPPDSQSLRSQHQLRHGSSVLDWRSRSNSPTIPPLPFSRNQPLGLSSVVIPPPPPPSPPPRRRQPRRFGSKGKTPKKHRSDKTSGRVSSNRSGCSTFSYREEYSASSESSGRAVDPVSARNARVFPPRFPAATSRAPPPTKEAAIENITSWVHERENAHSSSSEASPFIALSGPTRGLGKNRDNVLSSQGNSVSNSAESDDSLADTVEQLWQALKEKRAKVAEIKSEMSQQRRELRMLRRKRDDADNALMHVLRPLLVNHRSVMNLSPHILRERLFEVQDLWNDYNHREALYEGQELLLDEEEESLNHVEIRFFSILGAGRTEHEIIPPQRDRNAKPANVPLELRGISPEGPIEELHPHYVKLTSIVGDLQNAKEQHAELRAEREALEEDIAVKKSTSQRIPPHTSKSLEECQVEEQRLGQRVESLRAQTDKLKAVCEKEGVMRRHMSIGMQYFLDPSVEYESEIDLEDGPPVRNPLKHARFPELLSQPDHLMTSPFPLTTTEALERAQLLPMDEPKNREALRIARKEHEIEHLLQGRKRQSKSEFVNKWLLQGLRLSPLEASFLRETFLSRSRLLIRNQTLWQQDVLYYWFRDDTWVPYDDDTDRESEDGIGNGSVDRFDADTPPISKAMSRAESAPQRGMSPISRATDEGSAKTLDGIRSTTHELPLHSFEYR